jgi:cysteine desulfurase
MSSDRPIYLDYAATTPVDPRVAERMAACLTGDGVFGNPASPHGYGRAAAQVVEQARQSTARLIGAAPRDLLWTSGATESNNLAILGTARAARARGRHLVSARTEHKSVLDPLQQLEREGFIVSWLQPDRDGLIAPEALRAALRPDTQLVSIMHANNEIGVVQDIAALGAVCTERDIPLHVDAAQSAGKLAIDVAAMHCQLLSFTAHKLYGPKGIGTLYVHPARRAQLQPLQFGGGQERGLRSGTLPVHQIAGFGAACELVQLEGPAEVARITALRERLWRGLEDLPGVLLNGHRERRVAGILNVSFEGVEGESLLQGLAELALSTSAACNSDSDEASYVLRALGRDPQLAQASLRFSLGRFTTVAEIDRAVAAVRRELGRLRAIAP